MKETLDDLVKEILEKNDQNFSGWRETPLWFWIMGLMGEAGEVAEATKKYYRYTQGYSGQKVNHGEYREKISLELGDVFIYWTFICECMGLDPSEIIRLTLEKNYERFGWNVGNN